MIRVHFESALDGDEVEVARTLRRLISEAWPWAETDREARIEIIPKVQCFGQRVRDIDIVILAVLPPHARYRPSLPIGETESGPIRPDEVWMRSLCLVIEVKGQPPEGVRFSGTHALVRYFHDGEETWSSATSQNEDQKYSLKNYLEQHGIASPWVTNLLWFRQVANADFPPRPHNMLGYNSSWDLVLNVLGRQRTARYVAAERRYEIDAGVDVRTIDAAIRLLTQTVTPTVLDRLRMDRIVRSALREEWAEVVGRKQLLFRGRGGAGKTMLMLQLAYRLYADHDSRILLLTYNRALVSDLRRLFTLIGLPEDGARGSVQVQTIHSFLAHALRALQVYDGSDDFLSRYDEHVGLALEYLRSGAVSADDIARLRAEHPTTFDWHYVFIDEAQDWPEQERDLLRYFFPAERCAIADGVDQLVRQNVCTDWTAGLEVEAWQRVRLAKSLRMKAGLANFANAFARALGLGGWEVEVNEGAPGGRVIVVEGAYTDHLDLHRRIVAEARAAGNEPVDLLVCVPPTLVSGTGAGAHTTLAAALEGAGTEVWDGVSGAVRGTFPMSPAQLRIVSYDSCRGLEGWATINLGCDDFYAYKQASYRMGEPGGVPSDPQEAGRFAARWMMIPITRGIDTLVFQITDPHSPVGVALQRVSDWLPDVVEWHRVGNTTEGSGS
jgi:hypothetical protein